AARDRDRAPSARARGRSSEATASHLEVPAHYHLQVRHVAELDLELGIERGPGAARGGRADHEIAAGERLGVAIAELVVVVVLHVHGGACPDVWPPRRGGHEMVVE